MDLRHEMHIGGECGQAATHNVVSKQPIEEGPEQYVKAATDFTPMTEMSHTPGSWYNC